MDMGPYTTRPGGLITCVPPSGELVGKLEGRSERLRDYGDANLRGQVSDQVGGCRVTYLAGQAGGWRQPEPGMLFVPNAAAASRGKADNLTLVPCPACSADDRSRLAAAVRSVPLLFHGEW